jgi:K+/H+ antiporter YhaU regulatory subunit KhtT
VGGGWSGLDLRKLGVRDRYGLTVIGMIDRKETADGNLDENIVLNPRPDRLLSVGDLLIVLGEDDRIALFAAASAEATTQPAIPAVKRPPGSSQDPSQDP